MLDDDKYIVEATQRVLRDYWTVVAVDNVPSALSAMAKGHIEAILTDWNMPEGGGRAVILEAHKRNIPTLIRSGAWEILDAVADLAVGRISKSAMVADLDKALWQALATSKQG